MGHAYEVLKQAANTSTLPQQHDIRQLGLWAVQEIVMALNDQNPKIRSMAAYTLEKLGAEAALSPLRDQQRVETNPEAQLAITHAIQVLSGEAPTKQQVPTPTSTPPKAATSKATKQPADEPDGRAYSLLEKAVVESEKPRPADYPVQHWYGDGYGGRSEQYLIEQIGFEAIPDMVKALQDPNPKMRGMAAGMLSRLDAEETLPELLAQQKVETDKEALRNIKNTIRKFGGEDLADDINTRLNSNVIEEKYYAIQDIRKAEPEKALQAIRELFAVETSHARLSALKVLKSGDINDSVILEHAIDSLLDDDAEVRRLAAVQLSHTLDDITEAQSERLLTNIMGCVNADHPMMRRDAISIIANKSDHDPQYLDIFVAALDDEHYETVSRAASAIARICFNHTLDDEMRQTIMAKFQDLILNSPFKVRQRATFARQTASIDEAAALTFAMEHMESASPEIRDGLLYILQKAKAMPEWETVLTTLPKPIQLEVIQYIGTKKLGWLTELLTNIRDTSDDADIQGAIKATLKQLPS